MRVKRFEGFRKFRHRKIRRVLLFAIILPFLSILLGYILTITVILPIMPD